jgi:hypothetical protein
MRATSIVAASFLVVACVPAPHYHFFAPRVAGVVLDGGAPVADAEIVLTGKFTNRIAMVRSDGDGHFQVGPLSELVFIQWLIGDPLFGYSINITLGNQTYVGLSESSLGFAPPNIQVSCDLSHPVRTGRTSVYCSHNNRFERSRVSSSKSEGVGR